MVYPYPTANAPVAVCASSMVNVLLIRHELFIPIWIFLYTGCFANPTEAAEPKATDVGWHGTFSGIEFSKSLELTEIEPMNDSLAVTTLE